MHDALLEATPVLGFELECPLSPKIRSRGRPPPSSTDILIHVSDTFYQDLPQETDFSQVSRRDRYHPVPQNWWVVITDVRGSTAAIEKGRYKEVNTVGAATIAAVLHVAGTLEVPFVFGGDGASFLIPPSLVDVVDRALRTCRAMARLRFGMELRVGRVTVKEIRGRNFEVGCLKFALSPHLTQAMFNGGGLGCAESLIKDPGSNNRYLLPPDTKETDQKLLTESSPFGTLECRWNPIQSRHGTMVALIVRAQPKAPHDAESVYNEVLADIQAIGGPGNRPVQSSRLKLARDPRKLWTEALVRRAGGGLSQRLLYLTVITVLNWIWRRVFAAGKVIAGVDWGRYLREIGSNSDDRKFDDMLRMVLDLSEAQLQRLTQALDERSSRGQIVYGLHIDSEALLTCLIFDRQGRHIHFVDGNNGGYALAAKHMKSKLA